MRPIKLRYIVLSGLLFNTTLAFGADEMSLDQRVTVLERQMSAMNQIDTLNQVNSLEQNVQDLQGKVQVLAHSLETLKAQSTQQYADVDNRLEALKKSNASVHTALPAVNNSSDDAAYQLAYKAIQTKKYSHAVALLKKYIAQFPQGQHAQSANLQLGYMYILLNQNAKAKVQLLNVIKNYPHTKEAAMAKLRLRELN